MNYSELFGQIWNTESTATFWSSDNINVPEIYRLEKKERWYYKLDPVTFYPSATSWMKQVMPTPFFLMQWYRDNTAEYVDERMHISSHFGTLEHVLMSLLLREGSIDLNEIDKAVQAYWDVHGITEPKLQSELRTVEEWTERLQSDLVCIVSFIQEKNFTAHAIEWIGNYEGSKQIPFKFAGAVDLIGEIDFNGKRKNCIVDLKTGAIPETSPYQLMSYQLMWNQSNPDVKIDLLMNLKPGNATSKSKYTLKNWKVDDYKDNFLDYIRIAGRKVKTEPSNIMVYGELSRDSDLSELSVDPAEYVRRKHELITEENK